MSHQQPDADAAEVAALIRTALYDTGGESVEGGFVDRWESYALTAIDDLARLFGKRGFTSADEDLLRSALLDAGVPISAAVTLLTGLKRFTVPLLGELAVSDSVPARAAAIEALAQIGSPSAALAAGQDPDPVIRLAALRALTGRRREVQEAGPLLIRALDDPDPRVRLHAARHVGFWKDRAGAEALLRRSEVEPSLEIRDAILSQVYETVRREGTHYGPTQLREHVGAGIQEFLIARLDHEKPRTRYEVARALERLACPEVGRVFLRRLEQERDLMTRRGLLFYPAFPEIADEAFPILTALLTSDPDVGMRTGAAFAVEGFGPPIWPFLMQALDDPDENVRRAAAMSLGRSNAGPALPLLLRELWDPRNRRNDREFESAVRDVAFYVPGPPPGAPDAELFARIQARIDALEPKHLGEWPIRVCKEDLNALPLHATQIYQWCLLPDGALLRWDHESIRLETEPESDPRARFAVMVHGAIAYPELTPLIPSLPDNVRLCHYCLGRGWRALRSGGNEPCLSCDYLGWAVRT